VCARAVNPRLVKWARDRASRALLERSEPIHICLAWLGLAWLGLAWLGLAWLGLAWLGPAILLALGPARHFEPDGVFFQDLACPARSCQPATENPQPLPVALPDRSAPAFHIGYSSTLAIG
jgi:hypothetical protein